MAAPAAWRQDAAEGTCGEDRTEAESWKVPASLRAYDQAGLSTSIMMHFVVLFYSNTYYIYILLVYIYVYISIHKLYVKVLCAL